ncbi:Alcohol dehydrogenase [Ascochyta lentis]
MQFVNLLVLFAPALAQAAIWNLSGTCSPHYTCDIDTQYTDPVLVCGNGNGHWAGSGKGGRVSCTPPGTKCTYNWQC